MACEGKARIRVLHVDDVSDYSMPGMGGLAFLEEVESGVHSDFLLQEKKRIAEARIVAMVGLAMVFGGLLLAVHPYALTSIGCVVAGVILAAVGAIIGGYYDLQMDKFMKNWNEQ